MEPTDTDLARQAACGNTDALEQLLVRRRAALFAIARHELSHYEDAGDAVAETMVRVCECVHTLRNPERFAAWMGAIVRREARRIGGRDRKNVERAAALPPPTAPDESRLADLRLDVRRALLTLPATHARVLTLFYWHGASVAEIAQAVNRPAGTVKWMLSRGRERLAGNLKGYQTMSDYRAVLVAPNVDDDKRTAWADALRQAGWNDVAVVADAEEALLPEKPDERGNAPFYKTGQQVVVIHERIGQASAFELLPFLLSARQQSPFSIFLLLEAGRSEDALNVAAMSAYVSGVDFLLTEPFDAAELTRYARKLREIAAEARLQGLAKEG